MKLRSYKCDSCGEEFRNPNPAITVTYPQKGRIHDDDLCPDCAEPAEAVIEELTE